MRNNLLHQLIAEHRGEGDAQLHSEYRFIDSSILSTTLNELLTHTPPIYGACAFLSSCWAAKLRDEYHIPCVAVAGDLTILGAEVFKSQSNLPIRNAIEGIAETDIWDGHCWIEIDGNIGDASIFRTAYMLRENSFLRQFILHKFGARRGDGLIMSPDQAQAEGMEYIPKYVLTETQISASINGFMAILQGKMAAPQPPEPSNN